MFSNESIAQQNEQVNEIDYFIEIPHKSDVMFYIFCFNQLDMQISLRVLVQNHQSAHQKG